MKSNGVIKIIGDVGGTNCRIATIQNERIINIHKYRVADGGTLIEAFERYKDHYVPSAEISSIAIAAAGPPLDIGKGNIQVKFTNSNWVCTQWEIAKAFSLPDGNVHVINDFQAAAYAIAALKPKDFSLIQKGKYSAEAPSLVVGPGTGLGIGRLTPAGHGRVVTWGSEGGHAAVAAVNPRQQALIDALRTVHPGKYSFCREDLYCYGEGLPNLYLANLVLSGESVRPRDRLDAVAIAKGAREKDALCLQAVNDFTFGMGTMTGAMALDPCSYGGVYLIVKDHDLFDNDLFLKGMMANGQTELLKRMPVRHVTADTPAFAGLRYMLKTLQSA